MEDDGESLEETGENVKNFFVYKLNVESVPEIEHACTFHWLSKKTGWNPKAKSGCVQIHRLQSEGFHS